MDINTLPPLNATLNGIAAVLLVTAFIFVKRRSYRIHASLTVSAFIVSSVFLCFYLYHKHLLYLATGSPETSTANVRPVFLRYAYLAILIPHVLLAMAMVPMILTTFFFAATRRWTAHRRLAIPTFFIWLYVSITGVLIYFILYQLFPHFRVQS